MRPFDTGSPVGRVQVIAGRRGGHFVKASGTPISLAELEGHCSDILAGAFSMSQRANAALIEYRVKADAVLGAISSAKSSNRRFHSTMRATVSRKSSQ